MKTSLTIKRAADLLRQGGVIAYPTEGVYGLGCLPFFHEAVAHILSVKHRNVKAGLILIAADLELLHDWIAPTHEEQQCLERNTADPVTWIVTANPHTPAWLTGGRNTLAVRVTNHPIAAALSRTAGSPLVSTSANRGGRPPALTALQARRWLGRDVDMVVPGALGQLAGSSEIRMAQGGRVIRPTEGSIRS